MGDRVVDCARLESVCARKAPGVRIPPHPPVPLAVCSAVGLQEEFHDKKVGRCSVSAPQRRRNTTLTLGTSGCAEVCRNLISDLRQVCQVPVRHPIKALCSRPQPCCTGLASALIRLNFSAEFSHTFAAISQTSRRATQRFTITCSSCRNFTMLPYGSTPDRKS